jgi:hypothetical protein
VTPCFLVCGYEDCGVLRYNIIWFGMWVSRLWCSGIEAPCFLVCRYEDYGVQNATPRGLICRFEGYGVLGCDTMFCFWYIDNGIMVFQDVTPYFLVCGYQYYGVLECDTM